MLEPLMTEIVEQQVVVDKACRCWRQSKGLADWDKYKKELGQLNGLIARFDMMVRVK